MGVEGGGIKKKLRVIRTAGEASRAIESSRINVTDEAESPNHKGKENNRDTDTQRQRQRGGGYVGVGGWTIYLRRQAPSNNAE